MTDRQFDTTAPADPNWFSDVPVIGKLPPEAAAAKLRELAAAQPGGAPQAEELETGLDADEASRDISFLGLTFATEPKLWQHTSHTFGYIPPVKPGADLVGITFPGNITADETLKGASIKITLNALRVADYPGTGPHNILFDFSSRNQTASGPEDPHFNQTYRAHSGESAAIVGYPIFVGLNVGKEGIKLRCYTVNVKNENDEAFLSLLESDVFKSGLQLFTTIQPAGVLFSNLTMGITKQIATRNRNIPVQDIELGLDFGTTPGGARLAEGAYLAVQIPESASLAWDWDEWAYDPSNGRVVNKANQTQLIPYNYIMFGISRWTE
jgi:hypothetical protein